MKKCLTHSAVAGGSVCLADRHDCVFAVRCGFSYWCTHEDHQRFHGVANGTHTREELLALAASLRRNRREEFMSNLDDFAKTFLQGGMANGSEVQSSLN